MSNQENEPIGLEKCLLELLDPSTTPEKALYILKNSFTVADLGLQQILYHRYEPFTVAIFLAYIRFIMTRIPEACVNGIWEEILWETLKYSRKKCEDETMLYAFRNGDRKIFMFDSLNRIVPTEGLQVITWLDEALSTRSKCPNPYLRLELFRLIRLFNLSSFRDVSQERLRSMFIHTICEIQPHRLYPSGDVGDVLFRAVDLEWFIGDFKETPLQQIISNDLIKHLKGNNEVIDNSNATRFISHCIQIIGVFATVAGSNPDCKIKFVELKSCCLLLRVGIGHLVNCGDLPGMTPWVQFRHVITHQPFRHYVVETIRDLTAAVTNYKPGDVKQMLMSLRDIIAEDLGVCHKTSNLHSLLLSRQIQGPTLVHQHSLLLRRLGQTCEKRSDEDSDVEAHTNAPIQLNDMLSGYNLEHWYQIYFQLPIDDGQSSDESSDDSSAESIDDDMSSILDSSSNDSGDNNDNSHESVNND